MTRYTTAKKTIYTTTKKLGEGGEGAVYDLAGHPDLVAKIYHPHRLNPALAAKVVAMTKNPPEDATRIPLKHVSIAWPIDALYAGTQFVGYTMPKLKKSDDLYDLLQPQQRAKQHGSLNHRHLYRTAHNLAIAIDAIHRKGYVVGDVNFKNALFNDDALITMVDCDSMQVTDSSGVVHRCLVGVPEYTSPELQGADFARVNRTADHDAFGLAVLIFQLLMQGFHPFAGRPQPGAPDVEQAHIYCITHNIFPYLENQPFTPPPAAPSLLCLPVLVRNLFERAFVRNGQQPAPRPTPKEWASVLAMVESRLTPCPVDNDHWYPSDGFCVICEVDYNVGKRTRSGPKPSATIQQQAPLSQPNTSTTAAMRPAPVSTPQPAVPSPKPVQARSAPQPAISPRQPAPTPTQPTSTPTQPATGGSTLPPLVSPTAAPRRPATPRVPAGAPTLPTFNVAAIGQSLRQYRATVIPIAVILVAIVAVVWGTSLGSDTTDIVASDVVPTATAAAEIVADTAVPAPSAVPAPAAGIAEACTSAAYVAARYPMLAASDQTRLAAVVLEPKIKSYDGKTITLSGTLRSESGVDGSTPPPTCSTGTIRRTNPLVSADARDTRGGFVCASGDCAAAGIVPLVHEYQLVLKKETVRNTREIDAPFGTLIHFFHRTNDPQIANVQLYGDTPASPDMIKSMLSPFVRTRLVSINLGNPAWDPKTAATEITSELTVGDLYYDLATGVAQAESENSVTQITRIVPAAAISGAAWRDGTAVTAADYVNGWRAGLSGNEAYIAAVEATVAGDLVIRYLPDLPAELADRIAPLPLRSGDETIDNDSSGEWDITTRPDGGYTLQHRSDARQDFVFATSPDWSDLRTLTAQTGADVIIVDAAMTPAALAALASNPDSGYVVSLVPTGSVWILEK